ncbi:MAG: Na+/H+ antiporter, NhaA family protein nonfunctional [Candidatus Saccharibacteria bacterium]|nr:Na+/H+ antiporter, NhaA family protein nonfunctional [Candidatus Saccharibacteria bacterium]
MDKRFWGVLVAIVAVLGGIFFITNDNKANAPSGNGTVTNHVYGEGTSGVKLVEYGDFQCPACYQYFPVVKQVKEKYKDQITFQFRNFPIYTAHPNAIASARAAEAADLQGKFWEMHDLLYQNQQSWSPSSNPQKDFEAYAKQLGLDVPKFTTDFKSSLVNDRVQADLKEATRLKVESTPTFFIDGKKISSPGLSLDAFSKIIDAAIEQKTGKKPAATTSTEAGAETTPTTTESDQ